MFNAKPRVTSTISGILEECFNFFSRGLLLISQLSFLFFLFLLGLAFFGFLLVGRFAQDGSVTRLELRELFKFLTKRFLNIRNTSIALKAIELYQHSLKESIFQLRLDEHPDKLGTKDVTSVLGLGVVEIPWREVGVVDDVFATIRAVDSFGLGVRIHSGLFAFGVDNSALLGEEVGHDFLDRGTKRFVFFSKGLAFDRTAINNLGLAVLDEKFSKEARDQRLTNKAVTHVVHHYSVGWVYIITIDFVKKLLTMRRRSKATVCYVGCRC